MENRHPLPGGIPNSKGFTLLELIGILAVLAIVAAGLVPNLISLLQHQHQKQEQQILQDIGQAIELYLQQNRAFPPSLATLSPDYVSLPISRLTTNRQGYPRYFVVHPALSNFTNASGLSRSDVTNARFLLISDLAQDASPVITNATQFETWWTTNESATPSLHIYRGNMGRFFYQLTVTAKGAGGSYRIDGIPIESNGSTLAVHARYHVLGSLIELDEADTYTAPEVRFALTTNTAYWFDPSCQPGKQWNPLDPNCTEGTDSTDDDKDDKDDEDNKDERDDKKEEKDEDQADNKKDKKDEDDMDERDDKKKDKDDEKKDKKDS